MVSLHKKFAGEGGGGARVQTSNSSSARGVSLSIWGNEVMRAVKTISSYLIVKSLLWQLSFLKGLLLGHCVGQTLQ